MIGNVTALMPGLEVATQRTPGMTQQSALNDLGSFAAELAQTVRKGESAAMQGIAGTMPTQQVVQHVLEAERALNTMVAVRDKVVNGLLEITRMQI